MTTADFMGNWSDVTLAFMKKAEENNKGRAFVAEAKDTVIGTAQCMINRKLNPRTLRREIRTDGYIWSVYVDPIHRRQGLATRMIEACVNYLKAIGCTRIVLHASPAGKPVYAALGFHDTNEMRLEV